MSANCPRCLREIHMEMNMAVDGHSLRCHLCGYSVPIMPTVHEVIERLGGKHDNGEREDSTPDDTGNP